MKTLEIKLGVIYREICFKCLQEQFCQPALPQISNNIILNLNISFMLPVLQIKFLIWKTWVMRPTVRMKRSSHRLGTEGEGIRQRTYLHNPQTQTQ